MARLRNWLLTGLLVLAPSALTLYVFYRLLNAVVTLGQDAFGLLGDFDYRLAEQTLGQGVKGQAPFSTRG